MSDRMPSRETPIELRPLFEAARLRLARLRGDGDRAVESTFRGATELIARFLSVERVGIWLFDETRTRLRCAEIYEMSRHLHGSGAEMRAQDYPPYFRALERRRDIAAHDARAHPVTACLDATYLERLGITSMLDAPIFRGGRVVGVVCHEHVGPMRTWTREERDFAGSVADMLALVLEEAARRDTEQRLASATRELESARKMEALGRLASGIAHDLRNLLSPILSHADRIVASPDASSTIVEAARRIGEAGERASDLSEQLLSFGRPIAVEAKQIDVGRALTAAQDLLRDMAGEGCTVEIDVGRVDATVRMESTMLEQVVSNLVVNARDAMPDGGPIQIRVSTRPRSEYDDPSRALVAIEVRDQGTGIDDATREHIFEPFFTTKPAGRGIGLGLATVYRIVTDHGGRIEVDSEPGAGSLFRVVLPAVPEPEPEAEAEARPNAISDRRA